MRTIIMIIVAAISTMGTCNKESSSETNSTNKVSEDRMLLVLSAPSIQDTYYKKAFQQIIDFQISYANSIIGNDNVVIIVDKDTKKYFEGKVPEDILLEDDVHDIWVRDFTTVNPENPVQFVYTWASMTQAESADVQRSMKKFANRYDIKRKTSDLLIDGGNIVDNYNGRIVTTTRFMEDNHLTYAEAKEELKEILGAKEVAILEPDEPILAHSDGMVSWVGDDMILVNDYSGKPAFQTKILDELRHSFPGVTIIEIPVEYKTNPPGEWDGFESACGVNLNSAVTYKNIYVPTFNMAHDNEAITEIKKHTSKKVVLVNAENVCAMGGSVRCLTWQLTGENAIKLIEAAKKY
jgi:agmatine/peptidylarginine deiminase